MLIPSIISLAEKPKPIPYTKLIAYPIEFRILFDTSILSELVNLEVTANAMNSNPKELKIIL